jgi:hypothetical protein
VVVPELAELTEPELIARGDVLVVARLDRLTRSFFDFCRPRPADGWSGTSLTEAAERVYGAQLLELVEAVSAWRPVTRQPFTRNGVTAQCQCDPARAIRMRATDAFQELTEHPIICSVCAS